MIRIDPSGKYVYLADTKLSPFGLEKRDTTQNPMKKVLEEDHGQWGEIGADMYASQDGTKIYFLVQSSSRVYAINPNTR